MHHRDDHHGLHHSNHSHNHSHRHNHQRHHHHHPPCADGAGGGGAGGAGGGAALACAQPAAAANTHAYDDDQAVFAHHHHRVPVQQQHSALADKYTALKHQYSALMRDTAVVAQDLQKSGRRVAELRHTQKLLLEHLAKSHEHQTGSSASRDHSHSAWSPPHPRRRRRTNETGDGDADRRQLDGHLGERESGGDAAEGLPRGCFSDASLANDHAVGRFTREGSASTGRTEREDHPSAGAPRMRLLKRKNPGTPRRVHDYPRDERGRPVLPIRIGTVNIHVLGRIDIPFRDNFHNERYIYPDKFQSSRQYMSMVDPNGTATYVSSVAEEKGEPKFIVRADDQPGRVFQAKTPTGAWTPIVRGANAIRNREHSNSANGPDLFGFSLPQVALMIQDLPGADRCRNYNWQHFDVISLPTPAGQSSARDVAPATRLSHTPERCGNPVKEEPEHKATQWPSTPAGTGHPSAFSPAETPAACAGPPAKRRRKVSASSSGKAGGSSKAKKKSAKKEIEARGPFRPESPPPVETPLSSAPFSVLPTALFPAAPVAPTDLPVSREQSPPGALHNAADRRRSPSDHVVLKHLIQPANSTLAAPPLGGGGDDAVAYGVEDADVTEDEEV